MIIKASFSAGVGLLLFFLAYLWRWVSFLFIYLISHRSVWGLWFWRWFNFFQTPTIHTGGSSTSFPTGLHICKQCGWLLTYWLSGGWNWITVSSSSQNTFLTRHISSQVGQRLAVETDTCSQLPPSLQIISKWPIWKAPLLPLAEVLDHRPAFFRRYFSGAWNICSIPEHSSLYSNEIV